MALDISNDRKKVVTGQIGRAPVMFTWDSETGKMINRFNLPKGSRGVNAVSFSEDGSMVACVDLSDAHNVYVFDAKNGTLVWQAPGDTNKIFDVAFSNEPGSKAFCTVGVKHICMWDAEQGPGSKKKGLFGSFEMTSFSCAMWDDQGRAYCGGSNGSVYMFMARAARRKLTAITEVKSALSLGLMVLCSRVARMARSFRFLRMALTRM